MSEIPERTEVAGSRETLSTKEAYFASLTAWAQQAAQLQTMYFEMLRRQMQNSTPVRQAVPPPDRLPTFHPVRPLRFIEQLMIIRGHGELEAIVAPFWKRAVAEFIDAFVIFFIKIIMAYILFLFFHFELEAEVMFKSWDNINMFKSLFDIYTDIINMPYDKLAIIFLTKLTFCAYESLWTTFNKGATPGKAIMKIRVIYVEAMVPRIPIPEHRFIFQPQRHLVRVSIYPGDYPSLKRGFIRAFIKSLAMMVFFPFSAIFLYLKYNRTTYDMVTKTVVIERLIHLRSPPRIRED